METQEELLAVEDLLEKGEITQEEAETYIKQIKKDRIKALLYIKGGYRKKVRRRKLNPMEIRERMTGKKLQQIRDHIVQEVQEAAQNNPEATQIAEENT